MEENLSSFVGSIWGLGRMPWFRGNQLFHYREKSMCWGVWLSVGCWLWGRLVGKWPGWCSPASSYPDPSVILADAPVSVFVLEERPSTCQAMLWRGDRASEMTTVGTCTFLYSLSSHPTSSSVRTFLRGKWNMLNHSFSNQHNTVFSHVIAPPSSSCLPYCTPKDKWGSHSKDAFLKQSAGQCSVTPCAQTWSLGHQAGQFSIAFNSSFLAYGAHIQITKNFGKL